VCGSVGRVSSERYGQKVFTSLIFCVHKYAVISEVRTFLVFTVSIHFSSFTETTGFVDKLFECLTTKNYLGNPAAKEESKIPVQKLEEKEEVKSLLSCPSTVRLIAFFLTITTNYFWLIRSLFPKHNVIHVFVFLSNTLIITAASSS